MSATARQEYVGSTKALQRRIDNNIQLVMGVVLDANGNPIPGAGLPITPGPNTSTTAATFTQAYKTVAATGTPEALAAQTLVESVTLTAQKSRTVANTGTVYVGFSATNDTQLRALAPGEQVTYSAPDGKKIDLAAIFIDVATNGDGVLVETAN